jgi:hypothetical protein
MLSAKRKSDGQTVTAYFESKANGPFICLQCHEEVILKCGRNRVNHFAHANPIACKFTEGESDLHRKCKMEIFEALRKMPGVRDAALLQNRNAWLEPFQNWILTAKNAGEIVVSGSPQEKKALAQKVFGSNLVLDCKKARGSCVKPWSSLLETSQTGGVVPSVGIEPTLQDPQSCVLSIER